MKQHDFVAPDLGSPFQFCDSPKPIDFELTPKERDKVASFKVALERKRREQNALDAKRAAAEALGNARRLGVTWDDDGPEAA